MKISWLGKSSWLLGRGPPLPPSQPHPCPPKTNEKPWNSCNYIPGQGNGGDRQPSRNRKEVFTWEERWLWARLNDLASTCVGTVIAVISLTSPGHACPLGDLTLSTNSFNLAVMNQGFCIGGRMVLVENLLPCCSLAALCQLLFSCGLFREVCVLFARVGIVFWLRMLKYHLNSHSLYSWELWLQFIRLRLDSKPTQAVIIFSDIWGF